MPKFLKNDTITLLEAGAEAFLLGLYGLAMPSQRHLHKKETKYAPIIGYLVHQLNFLQRLVLFRLKAAAQCLEIKILQKEYIVSVMK